MTLQVSLSKKEIGYRQLGGLQTRRRLSGFQQLTTNKTAATESTKVGYVYGLTTTWTSRRSFAEKQKVGGVSGNPLRYLIHRSGLAISNGIILPLNTYISEL